MNIISCNHLIKGQTSVWFGIWSTLFFFFFLNFIIVVDNIEENNGTLEYIMSCIEFLLWISWIKLVGCWWLDIIYCWDLYTVQWSVHIFYMIRSGIITKRVARTLLSHWRDLILIIIHNISLLYAQLRYGHMCIHMVVLCVCFFFFGHLVMVIACCSWEDESLLINLMSSIDGLSI